MQMNAGLILAGQSPDILGQMARGQQVRQTERDNQHTNAFRSMLQEQGAGIMQGDQNALAALAGFDPQAALGVQESRLGMDAQRQQMQLARAAGARAAASHAAQMGAAERAREAEIWGRGVSMMAQAQTPEQFAQIMQIPGVADAAESILGPGMATFENREMILASAMGVTDALRMGQSQADFGSTPQGYARVPDPDSPVGARYEQVPGAQAGGFRPATPQEAQQYGAQAGQIGPDGRFFPVNPPSGMSVRTNPDGTMELVQGPGAGSSGRPFTEGQARDVVYATRARGALEDLEPVADALMSRPEMMADMAPFGLGREMQTPEYQQARVAGDEFLQAILRKDTGAAITSQEREEYGRVYLPQPGDTPEVRALRSEARRRALAALEAGMGPDQIAAQTRALGETIAQSTGGQAPEPAQQGGPVTAQAISQMTDRQLIDIDVSSLGAAELEALAQRLEGMGR